MVLSAIAERTGTVLVDGLTKTAKVRVITLLDAPPSSTVTAMVAAPVPVAAVLKRTVPEFAGLLYDKDWTATRAVLLETALTTRVCASLVAPELTPTKLTLKKPLPSLTTTSAIGVSVGPSFTGATVSTNELTALVAPSLTRRVIVAVPD